MYLDPVVRIGGAQSSVRCPVTMLPLDCVLDATASLAIDDAVNTRQQRVYQASIRRLSIYYYLGGYQSKHRQLYSTTRLVTRQHNLSMDAAEDDREVQVQKASADWLKDFETSLPSFLYRLQPDGSRKIRRRVRQRDTDRLVELVS